MATIEQRVGDHETRISGIEADRQHLATKADLAQLESRLLWRILVPVMVGIVASIVVQVWAS